MAPLRNVSSAARPINRCASSQSPDAEPYVKLGDLVHKGQTVCIVEAMKLMNEIQSEADGRITKILVENGQPVEYGQSMFLLSPA